MTCTMDDRFKVARSRVLFSRLLKLSEQQQRELEANPAPFLDMAYEKLYHASKALDDVRWILIGGPQIMDPPDDSIRSMQSILFERHRQALDLIDKATLSTVEANKERT